MQQPQQQQQLSTAATSGCGGISATAVAEPTTAAFVDRLKLQLLQVYDNVSAVAHNILDEPVGEIVAAGKISQFQGNIEEATSVIIKLEKSNLTKEILEMTRIGAVVNDFRKKVAQSSPELSKRCRALIKCWQKLAEPRPTSSGSSSTNVTPNYASPALRKGLTPGTPVRGSRVTPVANSRLTPAGNSRLASVGSTSQTSSQSTGSRADPPTIISNGWTSAQQQRPVPDISMNTAESGSMRRSYTVDADLSRKAVEDSLLPVEEIIRNGKRKAQSFANSDIGNKNGLALSIGSVKRPYFNRISASHAAPHQSLLAARRADVKSTSELVAQLTENLPGYLAINISKTQGNGSECEFGTKEQMDANTGHVPVTPTLFAVQPEANKEVNKRERRGRPKKDKSKEEEGKKRNQSTANEHNVRASTSAAETSELVMDSVSNTKFSFPKEIIAPIKHGRYDWSAMLPSLDSLRHRVQHRVLPSTDPRKSYIMSVLGREVLALPYVDVGMPDFLEYQFPESGKFYAEENFMYGASRPK